MTPTLTDRSRILTYQTCPRARYLGYHFNGLGLAPTSFSVPLQTGTQIHHGLELLLSGVDVDEACADAVRLYRSDAEGYLGIQGVDPANYTYTINEQAALTEALIRVYSIKQLPKLLEEYEIIAMEKEYELKLASGLTLMVRVDGLLKKKSDGELYVLSFKTDTGANLQQRIEDARHDLQGLTEPYAVEAAGEGRPFGVKMEWLVKGAWKEDERGSGKRFQDSYLIRPWSRPDSMGEIEYAWKYFWNCTEEHKTTWKNGRVVKCEGGKKHGLGDSYSRVSIWEHMTVKEWIGMLASGLVQPGAGDPLEGIISAPISLYRNQQEQTRRLFQITTQELEVAEGVATVNSYNGPLLHALDFHFPQHDKACNHQPKIGGVESPWKCAFYSLCWNTDPAKALENPYEEGYRPRKPHHSPEQLLQIGGLDE